MSSGNIKLTTSPSNSFIEEKLTIPASDNLIINCPYLTSESAIKGLLFI